MFCCVNDQWNDYGAEVPPHIIMSMSRHLSRRTESWASSSWLKSERDFSVAAPSEGFPAFCCVSIRVRPVWTRCCEELNTFQKQQFHQTLLTLFQGQRRHCALHFPFKCFFCFLFFFYYYYFTQGGQNVLNVETYRDTTGASLTEIFYNNKKKNLWRKASDD